MSPQMILVVNGALLIMLMIIALQMARQRNLFVAAMLSAMYSLCSACLFVLLDAVDVAFTEAAVGAGISTVLILSALALTNYEDRPPTRQRHLAALGVCLPVGGLLLYAASGWPELGDPNTPVFQHPITNHILEKSSAEIEIPNFVTSVLASYRGYDTMGEVTVVFTAGIAVLLLLWGRRSLKEPQA